jgi:hypothetical protein
LTAAGQPLHLKRADGLTVTVINPAYPLLKVLLPGEPESDRGIEIEFPEQLTGLNLQGHQVEHLYLVSLGTNNRRTPPSWHGTDHALTSLLGFFIGQWPGLVLGLAGTMWN